MSTDSKTRSQEMLGATRPDRAVAAPSEQSAAAWRTAWIAFGLGSAALLAVFHSTVETTALTWMADSAFNHGFLIFPICGYLIWQRRAELARMVPEPTGWGLVPLLLACAGWLVGEAATVNSVQQFSVLAVLWSLFVTVFGWRVARYLVFPLGYAVFAIPFGSFLVGPLQNLTVEFVVKGIELAGIPIFNDGTFISIPNGNFEVAEACAGLRFLIATLALGVLFAGLAYRSAWRKAIFLALCVVVPILSNGLRAFTMVLLGYLSDMTIAVGFDHIVYGFVLFAIVTVILLALGMAFRDRDLNEIPPAPRSAAARPGVTIPRIAALAVAAVALAAAVPAYAALVMERPPSDMKVAIPAPQPDNGWSPVASAADGWQPNFRGADATLMKSYAKDGRIVRLFIAYYRYQRQGAELVSSTNRVAHGEHWRQVGAGTVRAPVDGQTIRVARARMVHGLDERIIWGWYWIGGRFTADSYYAKALQTKATLLLEAPEAAYVAVSTDLGHGEAAARAVLDDFLTSAAPLKAVLARAAKR